MKHLDTWYDANTYYKLNKQGLREIISAFVFNDNNPSESEQLEFAKDFDSFFKINTFRFNLAKETTKVREDQLVCYQILMDHFDDLPDDVKEDVNERLNKIGI
ncbi:MAG: hypothetical protein CBC24_09090 [Candidatus Pelagibacter sp. TMED64]|mgnify:CR=1 FL=1|nr:MAG: hypothetical protein CBC24_09090 [Candidatus Pelagibacter sp. TMED64]|tara:strand:- start:280 stop:588 length:309 start_codon:yes stop_codon:yes gene_type:complete